MDREDFRYASRFADRHFNTSEPEMADGKLTADETAEICKRAEFEVRILFPKHAEFITVTPVTTPDINFAGYTVTYDDGEVFMSDTFQFAFGDKGIDVVS